MTDIPRGVTLDVAASVRRGRSLDRLETLVLSGLLLALSALVVVTVSPWVLVPATLGVWFLLRVSRPSGRDMDYPARVQVPVELFHAVSTYSSALGVPTPRARIFSRADSTRTNLPVAWVTNALVLDVPGGRTMLVGEDLLRSLSPPEVSAIVAHEVAHLAHATSISWARTLVVSLAQASLVPIVVAYLVAPELVLVDLLLLVGVVVAWRLVRSFFSRLSEHAADRSAALVASPEALSSALVRLDDNSRRPLVPARDKTPRVPSPPATLRQRFSSLPRARSPLRPHPGVRSRVGRLMSTFVAE